MENFDRRCARGAEYARASQRLPRSAATPHARSSGCTRRLWVRDCKRGPWSRACALSGRTYKSPTLSSRRARNSSPNASARTSATTSPSIPAGDAHAAIDALRPAALIFSKLDVWPRLTEIAASRGIALGIVSATLAGESGRRSGLGALLLRDAYRALDAVGAMSVEDGAAVATAGRARRPYFHHRRRALRRSVGTRAAE